MAHRQSQIRIHCMSAPNGLGDVISNSSAVATLPSPPEHIIQSSDRVSITQIRIAKDGQLQFLLQEFEENENNADDTRGIVIAKLRTGQDLSIMLEPLVSAVSVATATTLESLQARHDKNNLLTVPPSSKGCQNFIYLRSEDVVCFANEGLRLRVRFEDAKELRGGLQEIIVASSERLATAENYVTAPTMDAFESEVVQVESSNVVSGAEAKSEVGSDDSETNNEAGSDQLLSHPLADSELPQGTPRHSPPSEDFVPTVKETPDHQSFWNEELTFSTAPIHFDGVVDQPLGNASSRTGLEKPSLRVQDTFLAESGQNIDEDSQFRAGSNLLQSIHGTQSSANIAADTESDDDATTPIPIRKTHRKMAHSQASFTGNRNDPQIDGHLAEDDNTDLPANNSLPSENGSQSSPQVLLQTSDGVDEKSMCFDAAGRTLNGQARLKRKSSTPENEPGVEKVASSKRRKTGSTITSISSQGVNSGSETGLLSKTGLSVKKRSIPSRTTQVVMSNSDSPDEIIVSSRPPYSGSKPSRSSPQVLLDSSGRTDSPISASKSGNPTKITKLVLSKTKTSKGIEKWLKGKGVQIVEDVPTRRSNFVCIVQPGELTKTPKVLRSLLFGKPVVTEEWLQKSKDADNLLSVHAFIHKDVGESSGEDRGVLFAGKTLLFTTTLIQQYWPSGWADIQDIAKEAGADHVRKCNVIKDGPEGTTTVGTVLFFGSDHNDDDVSSLTQNHKRTVYHKDFLTHSIISGALDLDDQRFHLYFGTASKGRAKRRTA